MDFYKSASPERLRNIKSSQAAQRINTNYSPQRVTNNYSPTNIPKLQKFTIKKKRSDDETIPKFIYDFMEEKYEEKTEKQRSTPWLPISPARKKIKKDNSERKYIYYATNNQLPPIKTNTFEEEDQKNRLKLIRAEHFHKRNEGMQRRVRKFNTYSHTKFKV